MSNKRRYAAQCVTVLICMMMYMAQVDAGKVMIKASGGATTTTTTEPACTTQTGPTDTETDSGNSDVGRYSTDVYRASKIYFDVAGASEDICKVDLYLHRVGSTDPSLTYDARLWSNKCTICDRSDDEPDSSLGTSTNNVAWNALSESANWESFSFGTPVTLSDETYYWVVIKASTYDTDGADYAIWESDGTCATENTFKGSSVPVWSGEGITACQCMKLYK